MVLVRPLCCDQPPTLTQGYCRTPAMIRCQSTRHLVAAQRTTRATQHKRREKYDCTQSEKNRDNRGHMYSFVVIQEGSAIGSKRIPLKHRKLPAISVRYSSQRALHIYFLVLKFSSPDGKSKRSTLRNFAFGPSKPREYVVQRIMMLSPSTYCSTAVLRARHRPQHQSCRNRTASTCDQSVTTKASRRSWREPACRRAFPVAALFV